MMRSAVLCAVLALAGCAGDGVYAGGYGPTPYGYASPAYASPGYAAPGYVAPGYVAPGYVAPGYVGPGYVGSGYVGPVYGGSTYYYGRPGWEGHDHDGGEWHGSDWDHGGGGGSGAWQARQQALVARQQQFNQIATQQHQALSANIAAAEQHYNQQVGANPAGAPYYRQQMSQQGAQALRQYQQNVGNTHKYLFGQ